MIRLKKILSWISSKPLINPSLFQKGWRFCTRQHGTSAIEFAFVAPVFILMILGGIQLGILLVLENALEASAREASRISIVSTSATKVADLKTRIAQIASDRSGGIIKPTQVVVSVRAYDTLSKLANPETYVDVNLNNRYDLGETYTDTNGNGQWDADQGVFDSFGLAGMAIILEVSYVWDTLMPLFGDNRLITLKARTVVVNEDFPNA